MLPSPGTAPVVAGTPIRVPGRWSTGRRLWVAFLVVGTLAYYLWTVSTSTDGLSPIQGEETDHFNLLSRGFKKGHLHLDGEVPPEIVHAANPYDPALRDKVAVLHDASYYRGKYYIYFGPAPVVTLLLPFSVVTGRDLPLPWAVYFFCSVGYLALISTFLFLQRRHYPGASLWTMTAGLIALGGASMLVVLLRRANIWELSAASGFCYFSLSLLCLVRALHSARATTWAAVGGLALGLAVASRPSYILCSVLYALPLLFRWQASPGKHYRWPALLGAALGCGIPVAALLLYNHARFQNPLEFGVTYQLTSVIESESRHFSLEYVGFNFHVYFLSALQWLPYFPFANGINLPPLPPRHGGHEYSFGLLPNLPFLWFSVTFLAGAFLHRLRRDRGAPFWAALTLIATAGAINAAFLLCFFGSCIRYMVDFTPWFMLLACLGLLEAESLLRTGVARGVLRTAGLLFAFFSSAATALAVVHFYDPVPGTFPAAYRPVARVLNRPYFWSQQRHWPGYHPVELSVTFPTDRSPRQETLVSVLREEQTSALIFVEYLDETKVRFGYREPGRGQPPVFSPAIAAPAGSTHTLRLSIGGPYSDFDGTKGRLRGRIDETTFWDLPVVSFAAYPGRLLVGQSAPSLPDSRGFTGQIHAQRAVALSELARTPVSGVRVRLTFTPGMAGRSFPLLSSGRAKAGDILFVRVHRDGTIAFGYDHWGDALLTSPLISAAIGETRVVEFWVPGIATAGSPPELCVKVDGVTVWRRTAPVFAFAPEDLFLGSNPIGGSTCEPVLENGVFEALQLPAPSP